MESWKEQLEEWKTELLRPNSRDILIQLSENSKKIIQLENGVEGGAQLVLPYSMALKTVLSEQQKFQKHFGVNSLCAAQEVLEWSYAEHSFFSPVFLFPATEKIDYVQRNIHIQLADEPILNPYLEKLLLSKTSISIEKLLKEKILPVGWKIHEKTYLGNFHYHRHSILKDIDFYFEHPDSFSSNLGTFFNGTSLKIQNPPITVSAFIYPQDEDQQAAGKALLQGKNIVVSGPPGTGKSQFLANTAFQHALEDRWVVLSSEKQVAMQVVVDKLTDKGLGEVCLMIGNTLNDKTELIRSVQKSWSHMEQYQSIKSNASLAQSIFETKYKAFENKLERLHQFPDIPTKQPINKEWVGEVPTAEEWEKANAKVTQLNRLYVGWCGKNINHSYLKCIRIKFLPSLESWQILSKELKQFLVELRKVNDMLPKKWEIARLDELEKFNRLGIDAVLLQQDLFLQHPELFEFQSKKHKRFKQISTQFLKRKEQLSQYSAQELNCKVERVVLEELAAIFRQNKRGIKLLASRKKAQTLLNAKRESTAVLLAKAERQLACYKLKEQISKDKQELLELGIRAPETEITFIDTLLLQFQKMEAGVLEMLRGESKKDVALLSQQSQRIAHLLHFVHKHFRLKASDSLMETVEQIIQETAFFAQHHALLLELETHHSASFHLAVNTEIWEELETRIAWKNVLKFKAAFPDLFQYSGADFESDVTQLLELEEQCMRIAFHVFYEKQHAQFKKFHTLLNTSAQKLSESEKELKKTLRNGRNILIKEFNKQKQHLSIRQLMESDAALWVRLLKPVWMINPLQISEILPNEKESIDLLLIDEASQIPFVHAIPALYRAKQIGVVGDSQQMAPSDYFSFGRSERETALDRIAYHTDSFALNYHYRSQHPSLIAFSNTYFYEGKLKVFSPSTREKLNGLYFHSVEDGLYAERGNEKEADALLNWLRENKANYPKNDQFLIVAFSETQLQLMENNYTDLEDDTVSFKTLENVQGDEADHVLISLSYGRNGEGKFLQHFGPVNQEGGEKRLNVLFSRARKSMHLFSSVSHQDFKLSDNVGVDLLRLFHGMVEGTIPFQRSVETVLDKWNLSYRLNKSKIDILNPNKSKLSAQNWMTLQRVLQQRGWITSFTFDKDCKL